MSFSSLGTFFSTLFPIKPEEFRPLGLLFLLSFFRGLAALFFDAPTNTLFITRFGSSSLPYVYLCAAACSLILGFAYSKLGSRFTPAVVLRITLSTIILSVLLFYSALVYTQRKELIMGLMIWKEAIFMLSNIVMWASAGYLFNIRQGKRLFGLVASGGILATILGGLLIPIIIRFSGIQFLFLLSSFAFLGMLFFFNRLTQNYRTAFFISSERTPDAEPKKIGDLLKNRYLALFLSLSILSNFGFFFVDYVYFNRVSISFPDEKSLAAFFGLFSAIIGAVQFITSTFLSAPLMARFGLGFGLMALPALNAVSMGVAGLISLTLGTGSSFFGLILLTKLCDEALRSSLLAPSFRILYQPLPKKERLRFQAVTESIIEPLGVGLAGAFLLLFTHLYPLPLHLLCLLLVLILVTWLAVGERLRREYTHLLTQALSKRRLNEVTLSFEDGSTVQIFETGLSSSNPSEVLYCLNMLEEIRHPDFQRFLETLLNHPDEGVRSAVIQKSITFGSPSLLPLLNARLPLEPLPALRGEILHALCCLQEESEIDAILPYLDDQAREVQCGAMAGLMQHGGIDGILAAGAKLQAMVCSPQINDRLFAAKTLGAIGIHSFYRPLLQLLQDPHLPVVQAALKATEKVHHPKLYGRILECLEIFSLRTLAFSSLLKIGEPILFTIQERLHHRDLSPNSRQRLFKFLGRLGGAKTISILQTHWEAPDKQSRLHALQALCLCQYRPSVREIDFLEKRIHHEVLHFTQILSMQVNFESDPDYSLLSNALKIELGHHRNQILILLSFLYHAPSILQAKRELGSSSLSRRAHALELIDNLLSRKLKERILPLIDELTPQERLLKLARFYPIKPFSPAVQLSLLLQGPEHSITSWTRACALFIAGKIGLPEYQRLALPFLEDRDPLIRETAQSLTLVA